MKISIKFEDGDESDLTSASLDAGSGTLDELACAFATITSVTIWDFDAVVATMLQLYTSDGNSPVLHKACEEWLASRGKSDE